MAAYCRSCGAKTDLRKAECPVCGADQRKRRLLRTALPVLLLAFAVLLAVVWAKLLQNAPGSSSFLTEPAALTAQTTPTAGQAGDETVYVTFSGTKYHRDGCSHLSDTKEAIPFSEAIRLGYAPCADCFAEP